LNLSLESALMRVVQRGRIEMHYIAIQSFGDTANCLAYFHVNKL